LLAVQVVAQAIAIRRLVRIIPAREVRQFQELQVVQVRAVMTPRRKLITVTPQTTLTECMDLITQKRIRHLPVLDDAGKLTGMISIGDVVKALSTEKEMMIRQLEHYIGSSL
jgi:CBS domain-containing protein